jgi:hypothetical protein
MAIKCKNCEASIATDGDKLDLTRINALGEVGEWICRECLDELLERTEEGEPVYMHHPDCPNYCDYACNSRKGEEIAEQIGVYLKPPNSVLTNAVAKTEKANGLDETT